MWLFGALIRRACCFTTFNNHRLQELQGVQTRLLLWYTAKLIPLPSYSFKLL